MKKKDKRLQFMIIMENAPKRNKFNDKGLISVYIAVATKATLVFTIPPSTSYRLHAIYHFNVLIS